MKAIRLYDGNTYHLPQSWEEVSWTKYQALHGVLQEEDQSFQGYARSARVISVLLDAELSTIEEGGLGVVSELWKHLDFLQTSPTALPIEHFRTLDGTLYIRHDLKIFRELQMWDKAVSEAGGDMILALPFVVAIMFRKPGEAPLKSVEEITARATLFSQQLHAAQMMGLASFFLSTGQALTEHIRLSSASDTMLHNLNESLQSISMLATAGRRLPSSWLLRSLTWIVSSIVRLKKYSNTYNTSGK